MASREQGREKVKMGTKKEADTEGKRRYRKAENKKGGREYQEDYECLNKGECMEKGIGQ